MNYLAYFSDVSDDAMGDVVRILDLGVDSGISRIELVL